MFRILTLGCILACVWACTSVSSSPTDTQVEQRLQNWHKAIAQQDSTAVFEVLDDSFYYFGTDSFENWNKKAFEAFSLPLFRKGKSWNFKPTHCTLIWNADSTQVWAFEMLETWMGPCRGTSSWIWKNADWKLQHYHLSMCIPNDSMSQVLELLGRK